MAEITPGDLKYSWFAASGTEAIEAAIKIAKLYTGKSAFIVAVKGFHGKTMGSLSMMGKADYRQPMGMLYGGQVYHVPFGDAGAVEKQLEICDKVGIGVAGVLFEPIQGEAGAIVPPDDFWPRVRAATKKYGVLLIADEVQTGLGRTGKLWGVDHWDVDTRYYCDCQIPRRRRDAGLCGDHHRRNLQADDVPESVHAHDDNRRRRAGLCRGDRDHQCHACATGCGKVRRQKGAYLIEKVDDLAEEFPQLYKEVTGKGLLIGQHFQSPELGYKVAAELFKRGVLVAGTLTSAQTIRIEPPLIISNRKKSMKA